jgi:dolichyl-phosphate-mannose-protein mannosyltransferase
VTSATPRDRVRHARIGLDAGFFVLALAVFLITRLWGLERFPISFLGDEAIQAVTAADLVDHGFRGPYHEFLPTYFENGGAFNLSTSVYAQVIPHVIFGFSIFATRATSVLIALTGVAAVALILRNALHTRLWWCGALLLSITPAWFLHSRTALEPVIAVSCYAWFLYGYLRYRSGSQHWLFVAVVAGALAFYSYLPMQAVVVATALLLLVSDVRYNRDHVRVLLGALALAAVLALPYLRFVREHGFEVLTPLRLRDSYVVDPKLGIGAKLRGFGEEYARGLDPAYWYDPENSRDLLRHRMKGYGNLLLATLPFLLAGLAVCVAKVRSSPHRAVLIALACAPLGGSLAETLVTRDLVMVVPAALLTALGVDLVLRPLGRLVYPHAALALFIVLGAVQLFMLRDALANGPTWYRDYGLYGMQFGSREVGAAVDRYLASTPDGRLVVSPTWGNNTDRAVRFVTDDDRRVRTDSIESWRFTKLPIADDLAFLVTREEYGRIRTDPRFTGIRVVEIVRYPDGRPGFFLLNLRYSARAEEIFARERAERRRPVTEIVLIDGATARITYPRLSHGQIDDVFDGDHFTLVRTLEANPFVLKIAFATPREATRIGIAITTMQAVVNVTIRRPGRVPPLRFRNALDDVVTEPRLSITFGRPLSIAAAEIAVRDVGRSRYGQVHVRDLTFEH